MTKSHAAAEGVGVGANAAAIVTLIVPLSDVDPETPEVSAPTVTVHVPAATPVTVNVDPDCCQPGGVALQVMSVD